jgi:hypothetical protein
MKDSSRKKRLEELREMLERIVQIDIVSIERHERGVPDVAEAGVVLEPRLAEGYRTVDVILADRERDAIVCVDVEDVACWRAAELRARGEEARVLVIERSRPGGKGLPPHLTCAVETRWGLEEPEDIVKSRGELLAELREMRDRVKGT